MQKKQVAVLGSGVVGTVLADGFIKHGWDVIRASRSLEKLEAWHAGAGPTASVGTFSEAARAAEIVVLAVKGTAAIAAVELCGPDNLAGKTVIDTTNPIADAPPVDGVLRFFTGPNESLHEHLQALAPGAGFVKAFSCVGSAHMVDPDFGGQKPTMFICGNDSRAKDEVTGVLTVFGWETADMGTAVAARAIEPLCMLWCIPGFRNNSWAHAFKLLHGVRREE